MFRFSKAWLLGLVGSGLLASSAWAQNEENAESAGQQKRAIIMSATQDGVMAEPQIHMVMADDAGGLNTFTLGNATFSGSLGWGGDALASPVPGFAGDTMSMLNARSVQDDLELLDDQRQKINDLRQDFMRKVGEQAKQFRQGNFSAENGRNFGEFMREIQEQQTKELEAVLLPHQLRRLKEISVQARVRNMGPTGAMADKAIAEELGITEDQLKRMKEKAKEVGQELKAKIEKLREEAQKEILGELTREQMDKLQRMMGDQFEFPKEPEIAGRPMRIRQSADQKEDDR